jgi:hypothetical protein
MCRFSVEMTDTFAGEANYCWVRRAEIDAPSDAPAALLIRRAKKALGLAPCRHRTQDWGDLIRLDLQNNPICIFITPTC